ncbi:CidA/LrgA family protein [Alteromonas sp. 1_MG-2023]|uniref:CidA/LrgA family protein n=1 Tax=Alteromonas sp. 1_MG-2023 TaxID=3062669 RepID=UPI0026E4722C|nr:CidA/LrgA family protein [Alteromonas sp. 1_MG-2023]MDO6476622.1 CidA/LrgA family protein [Alteromonas sp. 1_MG-2023]
MNHLLHMLAGLAAIFLFYFCGEMLVRVLALPFPGTLAGLLMLLAFQFLRRKTPVVLISGGAPLLRHMAMLFVPAVLGVGVYWQQISENLTGIGLAIIVSTTVSLGLSGWIAQRLLQSVAVDSEEDTGL